MSKMPCSKGRTWRKRQKRSKIQSEDESLAQLGKDYQTLLQWANAGGFKTKTCQLLPSFFEDTGRGMACKRPICKGESIIHVPLRLLITTKLIMASYIGSIIERQNLRCLQPIHVMCVFLMAEKHKAKSSTYEPYIHSLPTSYTTPCYWDKNEINCLPSWIKTKAIQQCKELKKSFNTCKTLIIEVDKVLPGFARSAEYNEYRWAWCTVNTRVVYMDQPVHPLLDGSVDNLALAPILDMLNHSVNIQVDAGYNEKSKCYEIKTQDSYRKGSQVFISYGPHDNSKLMVEYGFVVPGNPHNCVPFDIGELEEAAHKEGEEMLQEKLNIIRSANLQGNMGCSLDGISWNLTTSCQILILKPNQMAASKDCLVGVILDEKHSRLTNQFLLKLLLRKISLCALPEDFQVYNYHTQMIQHICREQENILRHCIGTIT